MEILQYPAFKELETLREEEIRLNDEYLTLHKESEERMRELERILTNNAQNACRIVADIMMDNE
jgi:hypothetical protein